MYLFYIFKHFTVILVLHIVALNICFAQTESPLNNMDSLTEASYKQMLERQVAEREADSLLIQTQKKEIQQIESVAKWPGPFWYFTGIIVALLFLKFYLKKNKKHL